MQSIVLGTGTETDSVALYVESLIGALISGDEITNINGSGFDIFYNPLAAGNSYLDGRDYMLTDGGELIADIAAPTPEPASLAVLLPGLLGFAAAGRQRRRLAAR